MSSHTLDTAAPIGAEQVFRISSYNVPFAGLPVGPQDRQVRCPLFGTARCPAWARKTCAGCLKRPATI